MLSHVDESLETSHFNYASQNFSCRYLIPNFSFHMACGRGPCTISSCSGVSCPVLSMWVTDLLTIHTGGGNDQ